MTQNTCVAASLSDYPGQAPVYRIRRSHCAPDFLALTRTYLSQSPLHQFPRTFHVTNIQLRRTIIVQFPFCQNSIPGKVFARVLLARIQPLLNLRRRLQQSGFTACRSTINAILALRLLSEIHREFERPLTVAYLY